MFLDRFDVKYFLKNINKYYFNIFKVKNILKSNH
jgi:hypothetical protein